MVRTEKRVRPAPHYCVFCLHKDSLSIEEKREWIDYRKDWGTWVNMDPHRSRVCGSCGKDGSLPLSMLNTVSFTLSLIRKVKELEKKINEND